MSNTHSTRTHYTQSAHHTIIIQYYKDIEFAQGDFGVSPRSGDCSAPPPPSAMPFKNLADLQTISFGWKKERERL